jgi:DNA-directed RNA polymerase subunit RPC12/RpoP
MMEFLTGLNHKRCDICGKAFSAVATSGTHPYSDHTCENCGWKGTICNSCEEKCPKCDGKIISSHDKAPELIY